MPSFDSKYVMIHWDGNAQAVTLQWKRPASPQAFRDGLDAALIEVGKAQAHRIVADHSMLNLPHADEVFFLKEWVAQSARAGVQRLAVVVPRRSFVQIPKTRIEQRLRSGALLLHYFDDMDEARLWVKAAAAA